MNDIKPLSDFEVKELEKIKHTLTNCELELLATIKARDAELAKSSNGFYGKLAANASNEVVVLKDQLRLATERAENAETNFQIADDFFNKAKECCDQLTADNQRLREACVAYNKVTSLILSEGGVNLGLWFDKLVDAQQQGAKEIFKNSNHPTNHLTDKERLDWSIKNWDKFTDFCLDYDEGDENYVANVIAVISSPIQQEKGKKV